jgi:hypothetical protein
VKGKEKNPAFEMCRFIVSKFISKNINWPREIKIAKKLIVNYPDFGYWRACNTIDLPSLAFFLTHNGKNFLDQQKLRQSLKVESPEVFSLEKDKIGNDIIIVSSLKRTILDYLK